MRITSLRKSEAARRNGRLSKGPKTPEGKARSCRNALKHGFRAAKLVPDLWTGLAEATRPAPTADPIHDILLHHWDFWTALNDDIFRREDELDYRDRKAYCTLALEACYVLIRFGRATFNYLDYTEKGIVPEYLFHLLTPAQLLARIIPAAKPEANITPPPPFRLRQGPQLGEEGEEENLSIEPISHSASTIFGVYSPPAAAAGRPLCYPENSQCSPVETPAAITTTTRCAGLLRPERTANQDSDLSRPAGDGGLSHCMEDLN